MHRMIKNKWGYNMFFRLIGLLVVILVVGFLLIKSMGGEAAVGAPEGSAQNANERTAAQAGIDTTDRVKAGKQIHQKAGQFMQQQEEQKKQLEAVMGQ